MPTEIHPNPGREEEKVLSVVGLCLIAVESMRKLIRCMTENF